jgi:aldose 1-epimerase
MIKSFFLCISAVVILTLLSCQSNKKVEPMVEKNVFDKLADGTEVYAYTLKNVNGMEAKIINYGATVVSLTTPDKNGKFEDVVLGYDNVKGYIDGTTYFGAIVGRYGNRIGKGKFTLDGKEYKLATNNGENHLHGGVLGFNKVLWTVVGTEAVSSMGSASVTLKYISKDGEEGYPGTVELTVNYTLTKDNELAINYTATTDKKTVLNPTHHSYFNLSGDMNKTILDHVVMIDADKTTPVDKGLIPTGVLADVANTPMDFRTPKTVGKDIETKFEQLTFGGGYDHNWVLNKHQELIPKVASVYESTSGRLMEVYTDQPGIQFYCGNFLDGTVKGKNGIMYAKRTGLCLEAQKFPDSPNKPEWPSPVLEPGQVYKQTTIYKFSSK